MGSGTYGPSGLDSSSSLEIALDQAIARRFASVQERGGKKRRHSPAPMSARSASAHETTFEHTAPLGSVTSEQTAPLGSVSATSEQTAPLGQAEQSALAVTSAETALAVIPSRLSWRGIEVTAEFQLYAARVALGERLAPYRGEVLSRPCSDFPWGSPTSTTVPTPTLPRYPERGRSLKTVLWLVGAVASIVGALGVGAGATSIERTDNDILAFDPVQGTAALRPRPPLAEGVASARGEVSAADEGLPASLEAELAPASAFASTSAARGGEPPVATAIVPRRAVVGLPVLARPLPTLAGAMGGVGASVGVGASASAGGLPVAGAKVSGDLGSSLSPLGPVVASARSAGTAGAAGAAGAMRPAAPVVAESAVGDSTLFSDRPSF